MFRNLLLSLALLFPTLALSAAEAPDSTLSVKAERAFIYREWPNVTALYMLLADRTPDQGLPYSRIVLSQYMRSDTATTTAILEKALANNVPLDSVLRPLCDDAFTIGRPEIYEQFLLRMQRSLPWLYRVADIRLLDYYTRRRMPAEMVEYGRRRLALHPDDISALNTLAQANVLQNNLDAAAECWRRILEIDPTHYTALAALANYYSTSDPCVAAGYARQALAIRANTALQKIAEKCRH